MAICPIDSGRYGSEEIRRIFNEENRLQKWLLVEAALAKANAKVGNIPVEAADEIEKKASTDLVKLERVKAIEKEIDHDLMAMVRALSEVCGESGKWVHFGATSYDIEDTALALQIRDAFTIILQEIVELESILIDLSVKYKDQAMAGRTHGIHAAPITLGLKFAVWMREISRHVQRLSQCRERILVGKMSGAVGTGAGFGSKMFEIQEMVMDELGLKPVEVSTQIVQRDRHAEFISLLALIASSLDKFATEVRNLQRTEIQELVEPFRMDKQVGSSTMPAKVNPVKCERVCSLAKLMRSLVIVSLENIPLWHERDLTNSANERFIIPQSCILMDEMLRTMTKILMGLTIQKDNMERNLELGQGLIMSESITLLIAKKGMGRQDAHELVRQCAMNSIRTKKPFKQVLAENRTVRSYLSEKDIEDALNPDEYLGKTGEIIDRAVKRTLEEKDRRTAL
ncbi:MAG: adenylosuccinate lyase [Promethearchaeati archaeon SRVP18_Atabeyarchaeia-1]